MSILRSALVATFAAALGITFLGGCKPPKPGDKCVSGSAVCVDGQSALTCGADSTYKAMSCRGPQGCAKQGTQVACDDSIAMASDGCDEEGEVACSVDKKAALECHSGVFTLGETCKGPNACQIKGDAIQCDNDISDLNDPCHFPNDYACTADKTQALKCLGGKMTLINTCRGTGGCTVHEHPEIKKIEFVCDDSIAQLNDACDEEGEHACSMDKKALYSCKGGKFLAFRTCAGPKGCSFDEKGEKFDCDSGGAAPGNTVDVSKPVPGGQPHRPGH